MTLGERIRNLREMRDWSRAELAQKVGVGTISVGNWERNLFDPSLINLLCLADVFHMSLDELVGRNK